MLAQVPPVILSHCALGRPRDHKALRLVWHAKLGRQQRSGLAVAAGECSLVRLHAKLRTRKALILNGRTLPRCVDMSDPSDCF